jgi:hypothetical protein
VIVRTLVPWTRSSASSNRARRALPTETHRPLGRTSTGHRGAGCLDGPDAPSGLRRGPLGAPLLEHPGSGIPGRGWDLSRIGRHDSRTADLNYRLREDEFGYADGRPRRIRVFQELSSHGEEGFSLVQEANVI